MAEWYDKLLEQQLSRNKDIWAGLREHGLEDCSEVRLGFVYVAPGEAEAQGLVDYLRDETDYEVSARERPGEDPGDETASEVSARERPGEEPQDEPDWVVIGTTQPTAVSLELLDDWCEWMIAAGAAEGPAAFDGWAAQLIGEEAG